MARKKKNDWKNRDGVVYSTSDSYEYSEYSDQEAETLSPEDQRLIIRFEKRKGKSVTIIDGFVGAEADLKALGKDLKNFCGIGGSVKDGEILLQGTVQDKARAFLSDRGYRVR